MKRSDVVYDIKELIEINLEQLTKIPDASLVAELILYRLENLGMLPPIEPDRDVSDLDLGVPEWEPEDG